MKRTLSHFPLYALIFPAVTVLLLAANNLGQIHFSVVWRPLLLSLAFGPVIFLLCWLILRKPTRAGILAFLVSFFALTYGHFFDVMKDRVIGSWVIGTHLYMLILWGLFFGLAVYLLVIRLKSYQTLTQILNIVVLALLLFQVGQITVHEVRVDIANAQTEKDEFDITLLQPENTYNMPDVYFILLDKYGRSDALKAYFDYDNSDFIQGLEDLGFWVADCSRSNYSFTVMSLASQFNMDYVEHLTDTPNLKTTSALIKNNLVHKAFEDIGYTTIAFDMGFSWGNMKSSDYYFDYYPQDVNTWYMDPFEILYLKSTLGILIFEDNSILGNQVTLSDLERKAQRTNLILDILPEIPQMPGHKLVHAHIISPHPPYVFNPDGTLNPDAEDIPEKEGYPDQLAYLEPRILEDVQQILATSKRPPIIIIEGDHAFDGKYIDSNLLALYLPDGGAEGLDEHMTLINVFPYIFNTYFGTHIQTLPNLTYTHTKDWYESVPIDEWNPACRQD
jgi:hypothetical protein